MHVDHPGGAEQVPAYVVQVQAAGGDLQQHRRRVPQQRDRPGHDHRGDQQGGDRVRAVPPAGQHHHAGEHRQHRAEQVREDLVGGATQVDRPGVGPVQHQHRHPVGDQPGRGEGDHRAGVDLGRAREPLHPVPDQVAADPEQHQRVDQRSQHLGAVQPEGGPGPGGSRRDVRRPQRQQHRGGVGGHVAGVGQQRQRPGHHGADHLEDHHAGGDREHDPQPAPVRRATGRVVVPLLSTGTGAVVTSPPGASAVVVAHPHRAPPRGRGSLRLIVPSRLAVCPDRSAVSPADRGDLHLSGGAPPDRFRFAPTSPAGSPADRGNRNLAGETATG